ncbi:MAG: ABC transporter permease [Armatimonadetes bacterium]|nr:ABC transporter permease [Armatimonadota bacterium]
MLRYVLRRLLQMVPVLLWMTMITFMVMQLAPGDYFTNLQLNPQISRETLDRIRHTLGLDQPWYIQYVQWLWSIVRLDFGFSFAWQVPVAWLLGSRMVNTLLLSLTSMTAAWMLAIPLGIYAATRQYRPGDHLLTVLALIGISVPGFFAALLLLYVAFYTGWLPIGGMTSPNFDLLSPLGRVLDVTHHLVLPTIVLGVLSVAGLMRQLRGNMLDVLRQDYVRMARAKGLAERAVIYKHALRNALNPLVTIFGYELGGLLSGAALVEGVIGWPGLGQLTLEAVLKKDLYLIMGSVLMGGFMLQMGNLAGDIMLAYLDPRIRYE